MTIPRINTYPIPHETQLPVNTASWQLHPERAVLLIHDMQRYFLDRFEQAGPIVTTLVGNINLLRHRCHDHKIPVVYTAQRGSATPSERGLLAAFWGPGMNNSAAHRDILPDIAPTSDDLVLEKIRYSAFHHTGLLKFLHCHNRDQLLICGVYAHIGCLMTASDAFAHDVQAFMIADALADFSLDHHRLALEYTATRCGVTISTAQALRRLKARVSGSVR
jgi:isochorismate hydrolase